MNLDFWVPIFDSSEKDCRNDQIPFIFSAKQKQVGAVLTHSKPRFFSERRRIVQLAAKHGFQLFTCFRYQL
jgi:hypothetical protein